MSAAGTTRGRIARRALAAAGLALLLLGGWWSLQATAGPETDTAEVEYDDLVLGVEVSGTLKAVETDELGPPQLQQTWQFKIARMTPEGDTVRSGDPVLVFDASELQQRLEREIAERDAAGKRVEKSEKELAVHARTNELQLAEAEAALHKAQIKLDVPDELAAAVELNRYRLDLELADLKVAHLRERLASSRRAARATQAALNSQLAQAERQVAETGQEIAQMTRSAPRDGTVVYVTNWRDEKKKVGDACWRGESVLEVPDLTRMRALGQVHEADAGRIAEGQKVTFRLDAHPDVEFGGTLASIWRTVQKESWRSPLKVVRAEIDLDETDTRKMRPGMRFRGTIEIERVAGALLVPADAVFLTDAGPVVYRRGWLGHETISVELGRRNDSKVEVLSGLAAGDRVLLQDPRRAERGA